MSYPRLSPRRKAGSGFLGFLGALALFIALFFAAALFGYIWYRIMAPQLGLHVPNFWAVFWSTLIVGTPLGILNSIKSD